MQDFQKLDTAEQISRDIKYSRQLLMMLSDAADFSPNEIANYLEAAIVTVLDRLEAAEHKALDLLDAIQAERPQAFQAAQATETSKTLG